jgi:hypothetical protein
VSHDPGHPGAVDDRWDAGVERPRRALDVVRTVVAAGFGIVAVTLLALVWLVAVVAAQVVSPDHPGRVVALALAVPDIRDGVARSLADDVEDEIGRPLGAGERAALESALDGVLASVDVERSLVDLEVVDGSIDARPVLAVVADRLRLGADDAGLEAETAPAIRALARGLESPELEGGGPISSDVADGLSAARTYSVVAATVVAVPAAIAAALSVAVARRRGAALVAVLSGSLLLAALALTPSGAGLAPGAVGDVLHRVGGVAGGPTSTLLVLAALLPPAALLTVRAARSQRESSTITS